MLGKTSSGTADASAVNDAALSVAMRKAMDADNDPVAALKDRLAQLSDHNAWESSYFRKAVTSNLKSVTFWPLATVTGAFALLNANHGYSTTAANALSNGAGLDVVAALVAAIYFVVEITIPGSAHLISWNTDSRVRKFTVRLIGSIAFVLGVTFSLTILQSKFVSGSDSAAAVADVKADEFKANKTGFASTSALIAELRTKVKGKTPDGIMSDIGTLLSQPSSERSSKTVADASDECTGSRKLAKVREVCAEVDSLKRLYNDAKSLERLEGQAADFKQELTSGKRGPLVADARAGDKILASITGLKIDALREWKSAMIPLVAALITHLLWTAHAFTINSSLENTRRAQAESVSLSRAIERLETAKARNVAETAAAFSSAVRTVPIPNAVSHGVQTVTGAPLLAHDGTMNAHVTATQKFLLERTIMGDGYTQSIGIVYDHYTEWMNNPNSGVGLKALPLDRFKFLLTASMGLRVTDDGKLIGVAVKA